MKIISNENLQDIFSIFHDGEIVFHQIKGKHLVLKIAIQYLAQRIKKEYEYFFVTLENIEELGFTPWLDGLNEDEVLITEVEKIFLPELEILSAEIEGEFIKVACNQSLLNLGYCGGFLKLKASAASVSDEGGKLYSLNDLSVLCSEYWDEWMNKNRSDNDESQSEINLKPLLSSLDEWTDIDVAQFELGRVLGLFEKQQSFQDLKSVFWSNNPTGDILVRTLSYLVSQGLLESRDEPDLQYRAVIASRVEDRNVE